MRVASWACVVAIFAIGIATRFGNPDMSETRLLVEFWPRWLASVALAFVGVALNRRAR